jgi:hypothetical protein
VKVSSFKWNARKKDLSRPIYTSVVAGVESGREAGRGAGDEKLKEEEVEREEDTGAAEGDGGGGDASAPALSLRGPMEENRDAPLFRRLHAPELTTRSPPKQFPPMSNTST